MHEDVLAAVIRLDESVALLAVEPLHGSCRHIALLSDSAPHGDVPQAARM
jgi:hypothetical protein